MWRRIMDAAFLLRKKGVNGVGIPDLIIALIAHHHDLPVLSKDRHFHAMHAHLGLKLYDPFV
ncbi:hypothetical protein SAMN05660860_01280 [Geoalkalibacter ferrihydriticus]|uniref:PIN domain-containing protein n=2 Tax=Geoalkalibacter ferrihydriticus TaxID=392333 RepID=A0A1G9MWV9_9BACT|nr:hypothetical protein SAMN05660860_01280 [Geoalkalibacter ferrihydriticus]